MNWLLNKLFDHQSQPTPQFAFQGTVNWMRGLAILVENGDFKTTDLSAFYGNIQRRKVNQKTDTLALECLLMALHNVASLNEFKKVENKYSIVRSAIVSWYYSLYYSSKSMLAAVNGCDPQTHALAGRMWQADAIGKNLVVPPFSYSITDLTTNKVKQSIADLRGQNTEDLNETPETNEQAYGSIISYLNGTAVYEKRRAEDQVKSSSQFKQLDVSDFRTKAAKELRDKKLTDCHVNILVQAFRYRGKANYRDAIYLSYGPDNSEILETFVTDLATVAKAYVFMVSHYLPRRIENGTWANFGEDLVLNSRFELPFEIKKI